MVTDRTMERLGPHAYDPIAPPKAACAGADKIRFYPNKMSLIVGFSFPITKACGLVVRIEGLLYTLL